MQYLGDFPADTSNLYFGFNTRKATGEPVALANYTVNVFKDGATTPLALDAVPYIINVATGQYVVEVSVVQPDNHLIVAGSDYSVVLSTGTVDGVSVAGTVLAQFSIENRTTLSPVEALGLSALSATLGTPVALDGGARTIAGMLTKMADDNAGGSFDATYDSLNKVKAAVASEVDTVLSAAHGAGSWTSTISGDGPIRWEYTVTEDDLVTPLPDCKVWVTSDTAGSCIVGGPIYTNDQGIAVFYLTEGTFYVFRKKSGWYFDNPDIEEVSSS